MSTNTVELHRVLRAKASSVYKAFIDPAAMVKWLPPRGFTGQVQHVDARVGGSYKMSFTNFATGHSHSFGGSYLDLVPDQLLRYTDRFDDPNLPGEMITTVVIEQLQHGCELRITQQGIPPMIPLEMCYLGWQQSLEQLAQLIETEVSD